MNKDWLADFLETAYRLLPVDREPTQADYMASVLAALELMALETPN